MVYRIRYIRTACGGGGSEEIQANSPQEAMLKFRMTRPARWPSQQREVITSVFAVEAVLQ